jgi:ribosomal protein S18 acetylase RimI-like enzyme
MELKFNRAGPETIQICLELMQEFYALEHLSYNETVARKGLEALFEAPQLGCFWLMESEAQAVGYILVTFGFSLEFHGRNGLVDELYLREEFRGRGFGKAALAFAETFCREHGVAAVRLEVDRNNSRAQDLYRKAGYKDHDRFLLTKWIE